MCDVGEAVRLPHVAHGYANCIHDIVSGGKVMDVKKNSLLALALGGALCCGALQAEVSQALPERGESPRAICESPRSADGDASWDGSSSKEANHADEELASIFSQHRDVWGGVEFCRDYSGLRVYVKNSSSISLADPVKQKHPTIPIYFVEVPFSSLDLEAAQDEVMRKDLSPTLSTEPDPERGRVLVETGAPTGDLKQVRIPSDRAVGSHAVVPVVYVGNNIESGYASTRGNDASPFTSGADIRAQGFMCSLGPRVYYNGRYVMLTAGHCLGGTHYTPQGKSVGNKYTTSYPGNASIYGDWKMLSGKSYSADVYNSGSSSSSRHHGAGANFGALSGGHQLCTSGRTTGQICGFVVQSTFARVKVGNVSTGHITKLAKKEGRINTHGCNGFRGGDSGGPAYYNNGSGKMIYTGIVTGHSRAKRGTQYRCTYYVTQLSGVRAWKGSVKW